MTTTNQKEIEDAKIVDFDDEINQAFEECEEEIDCDDSTDDYEESNEPDQSINDKSENPKEEKPETEKMKGFDDYTKKLLGFDAFKQEIERYINQRANEDELFAKKVNSEKKNIDDCTKYILKAVKESGQSGFPDHIIYGLAVHYYDEENIDMEKIKDITINNCQIVKNDFVELTEEEKQNARQKAMKRLEDEQYNKMKKKDTPKKVTSSDFVNSVIYKSNHYYYSEEKNLLRKNGTTVCSYTDDDKVAYMLLKADREFGKNSEKEGIMHKNIINLAKLDYIIDKDKPFLDRTTKNLISEDEANTLYKERTESVDEKKKETIVQNEQLTLF